jgi:hypothetical protein
MINQHMTRPSLPVSRAPRAAAREKNPADTDMQARLFFEEGERLSRRLISEAQEDLETAAYDRRRARLWLGVLFTTVAGGVATFVTFMAG